MASGFKDWYIVQFKNETAAKTAYEKYSSDREIKIVEPDIVCESLYDVSENDTEDENSSEETEPKTCLDSKGSIYTGLYDTKDYLEDSADLSNEYVVGVVDTGVCLTNKFLTGRIIRTYFNACDDGDENSEKDDYIYHGTKVGSVIADNTLDNVKLAFYRVIDKKGQSSPTMISLGIIAAVNDGVDTLNLSLGVYDRSSLLSDAISMAKEKNIAVIAAAGNNHKHVMTRAFRFPACIDCVITVGSSNVELFYPSYFSNYGECVDLLAPGENVPVSYEESCYGYDSGTSFSTPYVVSLFLQIKTLYPELSNQEIERRMYSSAHKTDIFSDCELYGYGIIDAIGALGIERSDRPTFNLTPGSYIGTQTISITSDSQYEIYYTLDQSFPSKENGVLYTEPFEIEDDNVFVKAVAYSDNKFRSEVESELYQVYKMGNEEEFEITEDGEIVAYTGSENNLKIPETINGITVKSFAKGVFSESQFCGISMPDTLNTVSEEAFIDNNHMQLFEGKGVKAIEECAFAGCVTLMKADIPEVEIIEGWAFSQCKALSQIEAPKCTRIETESFYECFWLRKAYLPNVLYLGYQSFTYCNMLSDFYAPKLKELGECTITEAPYMMGDGRQFTGDE
ncbi:MAG: S8 family serine peptidase, partial [Clostridia bacterium]|nr:S8 family serine peptidase [Clostridia bacterium]